MKPEKLEMTFDKGGHLTATLLWDKAPKTCEEIVKTLTKGPFTAHLLHAQYAGSEVYFEDFPIEEPIPFENTTLHMDENLYISNTHPGGVLAFYVNPIVRSFCIVYGEIIPRRSADVEIALNVFAEIDDKEEAKKIGQRSRWDGPGSVTINILSQMIQKIFRPLFENWNKNLQKEISRMRIHFNYSFLEFIQRGKFY